MAQELCPYGDKVFIEEEQMVRLAGKSEDIMLYTTSEDALAWISENLGDTGITEKINLFKNKFRFRDALKSLYPGFFYKKVSLKDLDTISLEDIPLPFVIKPAVGFFSMGVYKVSEIHQWNKTKQAIYDAVAGINDNYSKVVVDTSYFIMEQAVEGDEYAIDAYFNAEGEPVILNIFIHIFSSEKDVRDRVYMSSKEIIEKNLGVFTSFLRDIGRVTKVKNFPVHAELRMDEKGPIWPVEINPMRFGGWCTTADLTWFSYGFNPYELYFNQEKPEWGKLLDDKMGKIFSIVVLDITTGIDNGGIISREGVSFSGI